MAFSLIIGGVASGKSIYAETLVQRLNRPAIYLATAQPGDDEMRAKIEQHKARRGAMWKTIEEPLAPQNVILRLEKGQTLLLDCVTLWLFNLTMEKKDDDAIKNQTTELIHAIKARSTGSEIFLVTNELGGGLISPDPSARAFQNLHGRINQMLAHAADNVSSVTAGLAIPLKGARL